VEGLAGPPGALAEAGLVATVADRHTHFRREQLEGAPLSLVGGVCAAEPQRLELYQEMTNTATGESSAMFRTAIRLRHVATREPAPFPSAWLEAAAGRLIPAPTRSQPRTLALDRMGADLTPEDFARVGLTSHVSREITAKDCDAQGFYVPPPPTLIRPAEGWNQGVMDHVWGAVPGHAWPALEMRVLTPRIPRQGDVLQSYTALLSAGHKIIQSGTWVFEARTGALTSVHQQVTAFFDLSTRKTLDMPVDLRARLAELATPDLLARRR
jgi:acyl-CoA thioesterase FadM